MAVYEFTVRGAMGPVVCSMVRELEAHFMPQATLMVGASAGPGNLHYVRDRPARAGCPRFEHPAARAGPAWRHLGLLAEEQMPTPIRVDAPGYERLLKTGSPAC